jgi:hypothetical protein
MDPKNKKLLTTFLIALGVALVFLYLARRVSFSSPLPLPI